MVINHLLNGMILRQKKHDKTVKKIQIPPSLSSRKKSPNSLPETSQFSWFSEKLLGGFSPTHVEKYCASQIGSIFPKFRGENKTCLKTTT